MPYLAKPPITRLRMALLSDRRRGELYAILAAGAWSSAGILQRQLSISAATQVAGRAVFAAVALAALAASRRRSTPITTDRGTLLLAAFTAVASGSFVIALNHATVAHVLFFQAFSPIIAAALGVKVLRERIDRGTSAAMLLALPGIAVMVGGPGGASGLGTLLALVSAVGFAAMTVVARKHRGASTVSAICLAQVILIIVFAPFASTAGLDLAQLGWLALLGFGQMGLGTAFFTAAARSVPAAELALLFLLEPVLGPLWTWIGVSERPSAATLIGGGIVLAAVALLVVSSPSARERYSAGAWREREE